MPFSRFFIIPGLLAIGLMAVVVTGEIDISVASTVAVGTVLFAGCAMHGVPLALAVPFVVIVGAALGAFNGVLVASLGLPSLAATLGTMGAYRGLAFIIGSERGYADFCDTYLYGGRGTALGEVLSLLLLGTLRNGMGLASIGGPTQTVALGGLLVLGVLYPLLGRARTALRGVASAIGRPRPRVARPDVTSGKDQAI